MDHTLKAISIMQCDQGHIHGIIRFKETDQGLRIKYIIEGAKPGKHGFHIHKSGRIINPIYADKFSAEGMCEHYNPTNKNHGDLNSDSHLGDLGNIVFNENGVSQGELTSKYLNISSILGRGIIVHSEEDDLGLGENKESLKTGNSGKRLFFGIIAVDKDC